ncbi:HMG box-containing protein [Scheffersomyces xylosifermentans]|uniref:HMG box-containing protein n=1 Tax=Scheffersomyces xylosifermentans TaxID=1304137 RepID=UPI00315DEAB5
MIRTSSIALKGLLGAQRTMIATRRLGASIIVPLRLASTAADNKTIAQKKKDLTKLKSKLTKEKSHLVKLETKLKERTKSFVAKEKEREQKLKEKEKKIIAQATKTYRGVSGYTLFVKESKNSNISEVSKKWNTLAADEKEVYQAKAKEVNEEAKKIYTPKPKRPAEGFALYLQQNYTKDGRPVEESMKELGSQWRALSDEAKKEYKLTQADKDEYEKKLKAWVDKRVQLYNESKSKSK